MICNAHCQYQIVFLIASLSALEFFVLIPFIVQVSNLLTCENCSSVCRPVPSCIFESDTHQVNVSSRRDSNMEVGEVTQFIPEHRPLTLKERLCMLIAPTQSHLAPKISEMFLDCLHTAELLALMESPAALHEKIKIAVGLLQKGYDH